MVDQFLDEAESSTKRHVCKFCNLNFYSAQALGGHQHAHRKERAERRAELACIQGASSSSPPPPPPIFPSFVSTRHPQNLWEPYNPPVNFPNYVAPSYASHASFFPRYVLLHSNHAANRYMPHPLPYQSANHAANRYMPYRLPHQSAIYNRYSETNFPNRAHDRLVKVQQVEEGLRILRWKRWYRLEHAPSSRMPEQKTRRSSKLGGIGRGDDSCAGQIEPDVEERESNLDLDLHL